MADLFDDGSDASAAMRRPLADRLDRSRWPRLSGSVKFWGLTRR